MAEIEKHVPKELVPILRFGSDASSLSFYSGSFCFSASVEFIGSVGTATCVNWDSIGFTISTTGRAGIEAGAGADVSVILRLNGVAADKVGNGMAITAEAGPKLLVGVGGGFKGSVEFQIPDGSFTGSIQVEVGVGAEASLGGAFFESGINTGYLLTWCQLKLC